MSVFEITMLLCFGFAWPFSVYKSYKSKSNKGKSFVFIGVVLLGYIAGIANKLVNSHDGVIYFYIANFILVLVDCALYWRNRRLENTATKILAETA